MLYFIKFCYQWLLPPAIFILMLAGITIYMYRRRAPGRMGLLLVTALLYLFSLRLPAMMLMQSLEYAIPQPQNPSGDVLLMLGNGAIGDVPDITGLGQPSETMGKNMLMTLRLHRQMNLPILISGGTVFEDAGNEASIASREFPEMGVPKDMLFSEGGSRNTVENAQLSKKICEEHGWSRPIVTVVALQAPRTAMIFEREGMNVTIYPTHYRTGASWHFHPVLDLVPDGGNLSNCAAAIREYLGIAALYLRLQ